ncbi:hypothetical protein EWM64_g3088 [Hericium alpestre]|uniref:FAD-binding domain-containing protein n=1 Tax=Hericium alpestre TaxID=135208 RepID=A0A4Z0A382_9AGAM|nr:hypothetical protein EWM64_g3088 [Hericium alpestre]
MSEHASILIVGSGPAGLISALTLRKNGVPVRIVERLKEFNGGVRGPGIQPRTQELLSFLGVLDDVSAIGMKAHQIGKHGVGKEIVAEVPWAEYADDLPSVPYRSITDVNQSAFEGVIRGHLEKLGTHVENGVELVGIEQTDDKVTVKLSIDGEETTEEYDYVIAADGAKGRSRRMLGIPFVGETKEEDVMLLANVECTDIDRDHWHTWGEFGQKLFAMKPISPAPLFQIQSLGPELPRPLPNDTEDYQELLNYISQSTDIKISNVTCASQWRANIRMAEKFGVGRVFLAGGAQGANTGMQDAANIAWKLALVFKGLAKPSLLTTYEAERQPVVAEMLNLTSQLHNHAFHGESTLGAKKDAGREGDPYWRPKTGLQLGINCRWSPIVVDGRDDDQKTVESNAYGVSGDKLRAGDRAPEAPGLIEVPSWVETSVFKLISGYDRHHVLVFAGEEADANVAPFAGYCERAIADVSVITPAGRKLPPMEGVRSFEDRAGHAYEGYEVSASVSAPAYIVVRPDGIIGAYATSVEQVHKYFSAFLV